MYLLLNAPLAETLLVNLRDQVSADAAEDPARSQQLSLDDGGGGGGRGGRSPLSSPRRRRRGTDVEQMSLDCEAAEEVDPGPGAGLGAGGDDHDRDDS